MKSPNQTQKSGSGSKNIQIGQLNSYGISVADVKEICTDLFKNNFEELAGQAMVTAVERNEFITDKIIEKLQSKNPDGIGVAADPDFQSSVFSVQREFAKSGDENAAELLTDLLVERSKITSRNLQQIVLNEALLVVPKLTAAQINALVLIFYFSYTGSYKHASLADMAVRFEHDVAPFCKPIPDWTRMPLPSPVGMATSRRRGSVCRGI